MQDCVRYRRNASACLSAAQKASDLHYIRLNILMAKAWLAFAKHDEAVDRLLYQRVPAPPPPLPIKLPLPSGVKTHPLVKQL